MDALTGNVQLLSAALDLKLVKLLRGAMLAADIASGRMQPVSRLGPAPTPPPARGLHPEPVIEPRRHIHPTPVIEPRLVIHLPPRVVCRHPIEAPCPLDPPLIEASCKSQTPSPIQPPWKVMAWENPPQPPARVKVVQYRPDIINKGSLIDFFI